MRPGRRALAFVLHSHIPYVRGTGPWPHGEAWLYEAMAETYIPLLSCLGRLRSQGLQIKVTLSLTPVLLEQLSDSRIQSGFIAYVSQASHAAEADRQYFQRTGQTDMEALAEGHLAFYRQIRHAFDIEFEHNLVAAFGALQDAGVIEIATSAATHGYLPLLSDSSVQLQLRTAVHAYARHFGREPSAIWLPECAYRPGLEAFLEANRLRLFFAETFMVTGGPRHGVSDQGKGGAYASLEPVAAMGQAEPQAVPRSSHTAYWVGDSRVAVLGRDERTGSQVWSGAHGYPGDGAYREFHKQHEGSGLRYWRVTDQNAGLGEKELYRPHQASMRVQAHANHFVSLVESELEAAIVAGEDSPVLLAAYDTELFGHWWAEGVEWLGAVLERLASGSVVELASCTDYVERHPPVKSVSVPAGSWGVGGDHQVWANAANTWLWPEIGAAAAALSERASQEPGVPAREAMLNQAARELLLMQASDWPFMMTSGQAPEFAVERFRTHQARFEQCLRAADRSTVDDQLLRDLWESDPIFPEISFRWMDS
jgi:1,4-alpha-glucan branching enzyme